MYLTKFLSEHPSFQTLDSLKEEERKIVLWAKKEGYARTEQAPGNVEVVSKHQIEKSKMWWEKTGGKDA